MTIDRENCEAWFLDYYEGVLDYARVQEMYAFLALNPDMREVFDSYDEVSFSPDAKISFEGKSDLKKVVEFPEGINENNYEEYFVGAVENVLSDEEKIQLEKFLVANPAKRKELDLLRKAILEPEEEIVFENKAALKKSALITVENFEEYAVAAVDGSLSAAALADFNSFLAVHPELQKEFELFAKTKLQPETEIVFEGKELLKKTPLVVTAENFDEIAVASVEGLLNGEDAKTFAAALAANQELQNQYSLYTQTVLQPDVSIVFEDKASLKKKEKDRGAFWWMLNIRFAAAAAVALLIGIFSWNYYGSNSTGQSKINGLANNNAADKTNKSNVDANPVNPNAVAIVDSGNHVAVKNNVSPVSPKNSNVIAVVPVRDVNSSTLNTIQDHYNAKTKNTLLLSSNYNDDVQFSGEFYNTNNQPAPIAMNTSNSISMKQAAMRWMKNKLDRSSDADTNGEDDAHVAWEQNHNENKDVTGFDLTSSAVNALGQSTGTNLHLNKDLEGTILTVGKYQLWLNHNN